MIIKTWINDLIIVGLNLFKIIKFKRAFGGIFKIKDLRKIKKIFNIKITRNRRKRILFFNQQAYIDKMISDLKMK
jgi:hypothetical protein